MGTKGDSGDNGAAGGKPAYCKLQGKCHFRHICNRLHEGPVITGVLTKNYLRGQIIERGATNYVMVIMRGLAISYLLQENGDKLVSCVLGVGDTIGEIGAYLGADAGDYIFAATDLEVCVIPERAYMDVIGHDARLLVDVLAGTSNNTTNYVRQSWILQGTRIANRIERLFAMCLWRMHGDQEGALELAMTHETVGTIIHAERANVSRALKKMEADGMVTLRPNSILIWTEKWRRFPRFKRQLSTMSELLGHHDAGFLG